MTTVITTLLSLLAFPVFWGFVTWLIASLGGWTSLATHYRATGSTPNSPWLNWRYILMRKSKMFPARYAGVMRLAFDDDALYLSVILFFRIGHEPLKVPYKDVNIDSKSGFLGDHVVVSFRQEPNVQIVFFGKNKDLLLEKIADL